MEKHINYIARTFDDYRTEFINFSKKYYPEIAESYSDSAIGSWLIDIVAGIGDNLSYSIDRMSQEQSLESANLPSSINNVAKLNGIKIPGPKASMCEIAISCNLPAGDTTETGEIDGPNWAYAPIIKRSTIVSAGDVNFQLDEDVDFSQQFNSDAYSNRTYAPLRNANGQVCGYTVTKTAMALNGISRIYKKVITSNDLKPFMEVVLPDLNVMNVESIIFKETANFSHDPEISDFYNDNEIYQVNGEDVKTYRYFEVDCLADQYRFGTTMKGEDNSIEEYDDYTEDGAQGTVRTTRYYRGEWKTVEQKFITEFTTNGYLKITFGPGVRYNDDSYPASSQYGKWRMSKLINNDMLGILPNEGWTMYVLYRVGGGISSNIAPGAINSFTLLSAQFNDSIITGEDAAKNKGYVLNSLSVTNTSPAIAGKDAPSTEELKNLIKYNNIAQERCVTLKDYKARLMMMPPKYGAPFRAAIAETNNKIVMSLLNIDADGKITKYLPETLVNNIAEYMSNYKTITDYIEIKSGRIYNIGFNLDIFVSKTYNTATVVANVIDTIKNYMDVASHDMGEDIFVGDIEKQVSLVDGVISIIDMNVYIIYGGTSYSSDRPLYPLIDDTNSSCDVGNSQFILDENTDAKSGRIDLNKIDHVLYCDNNAILEIKYPETDIQVRTKVR